jgi:hypothetical protein
VVLHGDGGGKVPALATSLHGRNRVARTLLAWARQGARVAGAAIRQVEINGHPGGLMLDPEGRLIGVMALDIADGQVQGVRSIVNPDKLQHVGPVADLVSSLDDGAAERPKTRLFVAQRGSRTGLRSRCASVNKVGHVTGAKCR